MFCDLVVGATRLADISNLNERSGSPALRIRDK